MDYSELNVVICKYINDERFVTPGGGFLLL